MDLRARSLVVALFGSVLLILALPGVALADPPRALPGNAAPSDARYAPAFDYDKDGCYPTPAIGPDGKVAPGLKPTGDFDGGCHNARDLDNVNSYSRASCDRGSGWCAYLYDLYFEKDQAVRPIAPSGIGHRHDIEHVVVWVRDNRIQYVSASLHGGYETRKASDVLFDHGHPKIVYHKDQPQTHAFRFADKNDDPPENDKHRWQYPDLVSWNRFPAGIRQKLVTADFGEASLGIKNGAFADNLKSAKPDRIPFAPPSAAAQAADAPE